MKNGQGKRLIIQESAPRDGFQMEPIFVPTELKVELINALSRTGLAKIEVTSFTSPKAIPALADAEQVMSGIVRSAGVEYCALVPNVHGAERALACRVDELTLVVSASESHNYANVCMTCDASLGQFSKIIAYVGNQAHINASLSTAFGCPFEGEIPTARVTRLVASLVDMGISRVALCDTTGMANPTQVMDLCELLLARWPTVQFAAHFHNTRGMGLANVLAALAVGIERFDASLGGLGGCPFAPGASGNICTEDLVHMLESMGYSTGIDLDALLACASTIPQLVGHGVPGQVLRAGPSTRRFPMPQYSVEQPQSSVDLQRRAHH
jgi:hydroxymethylglutaryl-CoA lyase